MGETVINVYGESPTNWEGAARNALVNIVQSQGENLPQSGTFVIDVKRFTAEGTYGLVYEATIQHYKVHDNASFTQGEEPEPTPTPTPEPDDERGCLIATAAYESPLAPQVAYLRHLRDDGLRRSKTGAAIVDGWESIYYKFSPYVAEAMRRSPQFKRFMRWLVVSPIVHLLMAIFKPFRRQIK